MNILQALYTQLKSSTSITSLSSNRIFPMIASRNKQKPYITYHQISCVPVHAMVNDANINSYRLQISNWTTSFTSVISLSTAVKGVMRDLKGTMGTSNFVIQRSFFEGEYDFPEYNSETNEIIFHRSQDYVIWTTG